MLVHIDELVDAFPPADPGLRQDVKEAVGLLLAAEYGSMYAARCIRIFRAYTDAGRTLDLSPGSRGATWQACLSELAHAQSGD
jgi:hypothetical protein